MQENLGAHRQIKMWLPSKALAAGYGNQNWAANDSGPDCLYEGPEFQKLVGRGEASGLK